MHRYGRYVKGYDRIRRWRPVRLYSDQDRYRCSATADGSVLAGTFMHGGLQEFQFSRACASAPVDVLHRDSLRFEKRTIVTFRRSRGT